MTRGKLIGGALSPNMTLVLVAIVAIMVLFYYIVQQRNQQVMGPLEGFFSGAGITCKLFAADWCPHCVSFKPDYKRFQDSYNGKSVNGKRVNIKMIDCTGEYEDEDKNLVEGYPTVVCNGKVYEGPRSFEGLEAHLKSL